jgi:small subunit ribosomal protein S6
LFYSVRLTLPISIFEELFFMMQRYEALLLTIPEITQDEAKNLEAEISRMVQAAKGSMVAFDRWGKYKLAYPIKRKEYGVYFLARFESPVGDLIKEMQTLFAVKLHDIIVRNMFAKLEADAPSEYQRPKSLEEAPAADVGAFLKENKMEGLLSSAEQSAESELDDTEEQADDSEAAQE